MGTFTLFCTFMEEAKSVLKSINYPYDHSLPNPRPSF